MIVPDTVNNSTFISGPTPKAGTVSKLISGASALLSPLASLGGLAGGLLAPEPGNATSGTGRDAFFGGISVGSKVVGSGTATTIPAPVTPAQAELYASALPAGAGRINPASWLPIVAIVAAAGLVFALISTGGGRKKKGK